MRNAEFLLLAALMAVASCGKGARINGVVTDAPGREIVIRQLDGAIYKTLDTLKTDARGAYSYRAAVAPGQPEFLYIFYGDQRIASLLLQAGDRVEVTSDTLGKYSVTGSSETALLMDVERSEQEFANAFASANARLDDLDPDSPQAAQARREIAKQYIAYYRDRVVYVMQHPHSLTVIPVLYQQIGDNLPLFSQSTDAIHFRSACDSLMTVYPESRYVKALDEEARRRQNVLELQNRLRDAEAVGYPDLEMPDFQGRKVKLSDLPAKVLMVYFWTAADPEQTMFNLDVLKPLYDQYHAKGFDIYAVSLDTDKAAWATVVRNQALPWTNVCDGKGMDSRALMLYNVPKIPASYIIAEGALADAVVSDEASLRAYLARTLK